MVTLKNKEMKKYILLSAALCLASAAVSCNQETQPASPAEGGNTLELTISADMPVLDGTKVNFNGADLQWEGNESIAVVFGDNTCAIAKPTVLSQVAAMSANTTSSLSTGSAPGVFSGTVSLKNFEKENIIGAVYPANDKCSYRYNSGARIVMNIGIDTQVQHSNNVLNGENAPLYAQFDYTDINGNDGGKHTVEGLQFEWGCSLIRFNIYGQFAGMSSSEVLRSISVKGGSTGIAGTTEVKADGSKVFNGVSNATVTVELEEECTIADKTSADGIGVYMALLPRGVAADFTNITVVTDKAVYNKAISKSLPLAAGTVYEVGIDLSTFDSRDAEYVWDGSTSAPTPADRFTSLTVSGVTVDADGLAAIKAAIDAQLVPVPLDMSGCEYESNTFPTGVFTATSSAPNTKLKSIIFPSNVTSIAAGASSVGAFTYCTALESVDLSNITYIGRDAFCNSGLVSVTVPNTVTTIGNQAFRWCYNLAEVYYNAPAATGDQMFAIGDSYVDSNPNNVDRVLTIGPDVTSIPGNFNRSCALLKKVVFEGAPAIGTTAFSNDKYLEVFECKAGVPAYGAAVTAITNSSTGASVSAGKKKVLVPSASVAEFEASPVWGTEVAQTRGYVITAAD